MKIEPRDGILLVKKHKNTAVKADIAIDETDEDKSLITCEVVGGTLKGKTIIVGKYALFGLTLQGEQFYFCLHDDIIGTCDYKE